MRYLALDVGERRVGVAVSDETGLFARPLTVITRKSKAEDFDRIARLACEQGIGWLIIGQPLNADGSAGPQVRRVERYAEALAQNLRDRGLELTISFWDEYLSTQRAQQVMLAAGRKAKTRKTQIDAVAAAVILQDYLEAKRVDRCSSVEEETD
jgi:putative Holliday junction resolvase